MINVNVGGPIQAECRYKTKVLKGNLSFESQVTDVNTKYIVKWDFSLNQDITMPEYCIIEFDGGSINGNGHKIHGVDTVMIYNQLLSEILFDVDLDGTWIHKNGGYYPDNEDITAIDGSILKFANKAYDAAAFSGLGRKYLRKNIVDVYDDNIWAVKIINGVVYVLYAWRNVWYVPYNYKNGKGIILRNTIVEEIDVYNVEDVKTLFPDVQYLEYTNEGSIVITLPNGSSITQSALDATTKYPFDSITTTKSNILNQEEINESNTIYIIQYDYDLYDKTITIPAGCMLVFDGGSLKGGTLVGNNTYLVYNREKESVFIDLVMDGTFIETNVDKDLVNKLSDISNDKSYTPSQFSGLGRVNLAKNIQTIGGVEKNILTQDMFYKGEEGSRVPNINTIFVIQYDYDLNDPNGENPIIIPEGCVLDFVGGSLSNGTLVGDGTALTGEIKLDTRLYGSYINTEFHTSYFADFRFENLYDVFAINNHSELHLDSDVVMEKVLRSKSNETLNHVKIIGYNHKILNCDYLAVVGDIFLKDVEFVYDDASSEIEDFNESQNVFAYKKSGETIALNYHIENVTLDGGFACGMLVKLNAKDIFVKLFMSGCDISHTVMGGIRISATVEAIVENNYLHDMGHENKFGNVGFRDDRNKVIAILFGVNGVKMDEYPCKNTIIENNVISNLVSIYTDPSENDARELHGVLCYGHDIIVRNNTMKNLSSSFNSVTDTGQDAEMLYIKGYNCFIDNNEIENGGGSCSNAAITLKVKQSHNNIITNNHVFGNVFTHPLIMTGGRNNSIRNNLFELTIPQDSEVYATRDALISLYQAEVSDTYTVEITTSSSIPTGGIQLSEDPGIEDGDDYVAADLSTLSDVAPLPTSTATPVKYYLSDDETIPTYTIWTVSKNVSTSYESVDFSNNNVIFRNIKIGTFYNGTLWKIPPVMTVKRTQADIGIKNNAIIIDGLSIDLGESSLQLTNFVFLRSYNDVDPLTFENNMFSFDNIPESIYLFFNNVNDAKISFVNNKFMLNNCQNNRLIVLNKGNDSSAAVDFIENKCVISSTTGTLAAFNTFLQANVCNVRNNIFNFINATYSKMVAYSTTDDDQVIIVSGSYIGNSISGTNEKPCYVELCDIGTSNLRPLVAPQNFIYYDTDLKKFLTYGIKAIGSPDIDVVLKPCGTEGGGDTATRANEYSEGTNIVVWGASNGVEMSFSQDGNFNDETAIIFSSGVPVVINTPSNVTYPVICFKNPREDRSGRFKIYSAENCAFWSEYDGATPGVKRSGLAAERPNGNDVYVGFTYFATDLGINGKPIFWNGTDWVEAIESLVVTQIKLTDNVTYDQLTLLAHGATTFGACNEAVIYLNADVAVTNVLIYYDVESNKVRNTTFTQDGNELTITTDNWGFLVQKIVVVSKYGKAELLFTW